MKFLLSKFFGVLLVLVLFRSVSFAQGQPYLSAPVNGSYWELTTPTLYWWYVPTPYSAGPFVYNVQVSSRQNDFSASYLLVNANVTSGGTGTYSIGTSVGLIQGITYYWRVGVGGNYSAVWGFSPYNYGTVTTYDIVSSAGAHGTISPLGTITVARGATRDYTITANSGYYISGLTVDNLSVTPASTYSFQNVTSSHTINATFTAIPKYDTTFVNFNTGSDSNGDGTRAHPYKKIQRGHDRTAAGGLVYVFNGNYAEDVVLTKPITILGQSNPSTRSFLIRANKISIKNFDVTQSSPGPGIQKVGLESYDYLEKVTLENINIFNNAEMGLLFENMDSISVKNCHLYGNDMGGIVLINCNHIVLQDLGIEDNLRGLSAYKCTDINISNLYSEDNGKAYPANVPDKNGITFSICSNITCNGVTANKNAEQGIKFEECGNISLTSVSANQNTTDGMVFILCNHIAYKNGTASSNGTGANDNGFEFVACNDVNVSSVAANNNANKGFFFYYNYAGIFEWNPATNTSSTHDPFFGPSTQVIFTDVTADNNANDGFFGVHLSYFTGNNLTLTNNGSNGLLLDAAHHISLVGGHFDSNLNGIALMPTVNTHPIAPALSSDEITTFSLTGEATISNNTFYGVLLSPATNTVITKPLLYGKLKIENNAVCGIWIVGKVSDPTFGGLFLKTVAPNASAGITVTDLNATNKVQGLKISNSYFNGYNGDNVPATAAISLATASAGAANNVDAKNNIFVGPGNSLIANTTELKKIIIDNEDSPALGIVEVAGWTNGTPSINIGSASSYTNALVTIPVNLNVSAVPQSLSQLIGKIYFNELHLRFKYATYGTGTLIHDADWAILFDHSVASELRFAAIGFNAINSTGTLFNLTFEIVDNAVRTEPVTGIAGEWTINGGGAPFVINNGNINYTPSLTTSLIKGDATMDGTVDNGDYIRVFNHINGVSLTGQALTNADVNKDSRVDELDAADIMSYLTTGTWSNAATQGVGNLMIATSSVDQQGILRFPITLSNSSDVRSLAVEFKYDDSKVDFRNYIQLMQDKGIYVEAKTVSKGVARMFFTSANGSKGNIVPAEIMFNIKGDLSSSVIKSTYSINGGTAKVGPTYGNTSITDVEATKLLPTKFEVEQNYPNPFNPTTTIRYSIPSDEIVTIKIYDILGKTVATLLNKDMKAGNYSIQWNGENNFGSKVASGTYFYQVKTGSNIITKKMLLIK